MTQHDFVVSDAPGKPIRLDLQDALQALVSLSSGNTAPAAPYAGMFWLDTSVLPDGQLRMRNQANTAWIGIAGFPGKASSAEVIAGTDDTKFVTPKGIADADAALASIMRNRIVNPAMQISQEQGNNAGTINGFYPADQWRSAHSFSGALTLQRVAAVTPKGSKYRLRYTITTGDSAMGTNKSVAFYQALEGLVVADFRYGLATPKQVILRFGFKGPAGVYSVGLHNDAGNRSYVAPFTITAAQANTDTEQVFVIPGDITGAWRTDNGRGMAFYINLAMGTTYQTATINTWIAGSFEAPTTISNFAGTVGNIAELFDVGLYVDLFNTGVAPLWEMPDEPHELLRCERYYCANHSFETHQHCLNANSYYAMSYGPVAMRIAGATMTGISTAAQACPNAFGSVTYFDDLRAFREGRTANASSYIYYESDAQANARM